METGGLLAEERAKQFRVSKESMKSLSSYFFALI